MQNRKRKISEKWAEIKPEYEQKQKEKVDVGCVNVAYLPAFDDTQFYPTPDKLAGIMLGFVDWKKVETVLEPSAGKGDLAESAVKAWKNCWGRGYYDSEDRKAKFDVIEIDPNLRYILNGKKFRIVGDDFLAFNSFKNYDLVLMNPPFNKGAEHLLHAIMMQEKNGGQIVCLLNAETLRNPYTNERKLLLQKLEQHGAKIKYVADAFNKAQRKARVDVAVIGIDIPKPQRTSFIFDGLKKAQVEEQKNRAKDPEALARYGWQEQLVDAYNLEAKAGIAFMDEYEAIRPYIMQDANPDEYTHPLIELKIGGESVNRVSDEDRNHFLKNLRLKYWHMLLSHRELTDNMTRDMENEYHSKINELADYDFDLYNIRRVMVEIRGQLNRGVHESILKLFDELSTQHSWYPECQNNIHYYNGWKTNKAHKVGMKVIIPCNGAFATGFVGKNHDKWGYTDELDTYSIVRTIFDFERALNYLERGEVEFRHDINAVINYANMQGKKTIDFTYFDATFYKKGTCHIKFRPEFAPIIDRFNIYAGRDKNWLPPDYGKKHYDSMDEESKAVIDEFQGKEAYEAVMKNPDNYLITAESGLLQLGA